MNDRRVVAVFGPLLIGSALQRKARRRRKKVARIIATAPIKAVRIDGYRHIGSVGAVRGVQVFQRQLFLNGDEGRRTAQPPTGGAVKL